MSGIVGIAKPGNHTTVKRMLDKIAYRGHSSRITETASATIGVTRTNYSQSHSLSTP
ncbi:MAG: hypothetical protein WAV05_10040 [Anaerolineales bacterium]